MNAYEELKERHQKEINAFPLGFAFSKEQFKQMMEKWGLTENDTDKIYSIGAGGFGGHCVNSEEQEYTYERDKNGGIVVFHWSEKFGGWRRGSDQSVRLKRGRHEYYDYNF